MILLAALLVTHVFANTWVQLGVCPSWSYLTTETWGELICSSPNYCTTGSHQSPTKIASELPIIDGSLQALQFVGYNAGNVVLSYDGVNMWIEYVNQASFFNPGSDVVWNSRSIQFSTHHEQLLFSGIDRLSLDFYHWQKQTTWNTFPIGTEAVAIFQMLFRLGNASTFLDPFFQAMKSFVKPTSPNSAVQRATVSWPGVFNEFKALQQELADSYFTFPGSLTGPPCSEQVQYFLFDFEWTISQSQFDIISTLIGTIQRPVQRAISRVPYFDSTTTPPQPPSFSDLSNGSIGAIILAILVGIVALLAIIFGIISKSSSGPAQY
jgi:carbonic anhydrase